MKRLHRLSSLAMSGADVSTLLREALRAMMSLHHADFGMVQLYDPAAARLELTVQRGHGPPSRDALADVDSRDLCICGRALETRNRVSVENVQSAPDAPLFPAGNAGFVAGQATPLLTASGVVLGMISTYFRSPRQLTQSELALTDLYARQAAGAVHRTRAERALRESEERFRLALAAAGMGTFGWSIPDDRIDLDMRAREILGVPAGVRVDKAFVIDRLVHPEDRAHCEEAIDLALDPSGDGVLRDEIRMQRYCDGQEIWAAVDSQTGFEGDPPRAVRIAGTLADVTVRQRADAALRASERRHAFLLELSDALRPLTDPVEIQAAATEVLGRHLRASRALYGEVESEPHGDCYVVRQNYCAAGISSVVGRIRVNDYGAALLDELRAGRTLVVHDVAKEPRLSDQERKAHADVLRAYVAAPLIKQGRPVAFIAVHQTEPRDWARWEIEVVEEAADRTWAALERARAEARVREADRRKDEFLATLAHELRNPLAPLRNGLQIARLTIRPDSPLHRTVEMMDRQLSHLVRLVDDLLDVGRISSGKLVLQREPTTLADVLARSMEASQAAIDAHRHELVVEVGDQSVMVLGDRDRLAQVFSNLLSNAAKYTDPGGRIRLSLVREGADAVVRVTDTGIGIPPSELPHVFDLFSQVRSHQGREEGGLGIGLSLVKRLVELHDGTVSAYSAGAGRGSTFTVRLPLHDPAPAVETRSSPQSSPQSSIIARRVLVVDDNRDAAESLASLLRLLGHEVWLAHDGASAIETARTLEPQVVFLDLSMPRMGGLEAARHLRAVPGGGAMMLVAVTGRGRPEDRSETHRAGFDSHMIKPVGMDALVALLDRPAVRH